MQKFRTEVQNFCLQFFCQCKLAGANTLDINAESFHCHSPEHSLIQHKLFSLFSQLL